MERIDVLGQFFTSVLQRYSCSTHNLNGDVDRSHCKLINSFLKRFFDVEL